MGPNTTRNSTRKKRMAFIGKLLVTVCLIVAFAFANFSTVNADAGDVPAHSKTATSNDDGTFKLELSVTGDAETNVQTASNVNILIIYDESSSMTSNNVTTNPNRNRADYTEDIMHDFIVAIRRYQNTQNPENIQMALVGFGPNATTRQTWTSNLADDGQGINRFFDDGVDGTITNSGTNSHGYSGNNGTNWQAAMSQAQTLLNSADSDPTFVILVTDGAPTAASGQTTINPAGNRPWTDFRVYYSAATQGAYDIQSRANTTLFGIYAYGTEADLLDDLIYYSNNGSHRVINGYNISTCETQQHNFGSTEETDNYFSANNTAALTQAVENIFQTIVRALGITSVAISDGTTSQVTTTTGAISKLLDVDENSYQYWLSVPVVNNQFNRVDLVSGETVTYTVSDNGNGTCTVTWGSNSLTVNGTVLNGQLKYEWTGANALYNYAPPAAQLVESAVNWDLSDVGTLLDGVTYSVTFDVYPSQTSLDIVADIKNDPGASGAWGDLDPQIQNYIDVNGNLKTNTTATLTYSDTRLQNPGPKTAGFTNPDPVTMSAVEQLAVSKEWENAMDGREAEPITLTVTRDGADQYTVKLGELIDPDDPESERKWTDNVYISIGILRHVNDGEYTDSEGNKFEVLESGHEFTFKEPKDLGYYWELEVPTVRPMLIDGTITMLIKKDATHTNPGNAVEYTFAGSTYYVGSTGDAKLTATNHRRARLNVTKAVDGEDSDPNQTFRFTMNVVDSKASEGSADNLNSDYWVWFSVWNGGYVDALVSGAQKEMKDGAWTGFYYAPSGTDIVVDLKAGDNLRFINLPADSTYTITEDTLPANYAFTSSVLGAKTWDDEGHEITVPNSDADPNFSGAQTTAGKIVLTNTDYTVTYTNTYGLTDVEITKVWEDNGNQDGIRPTAASFKSYLVLKADGTDVTSVNADKLTVTDNSDNTYTVKWTGLDRYASGDEIKYSVEESKITGYNTTGSPAEDHGTITNEHTPEVTSVKVVKVWNDSDNIGGIRPASINVQLKAGGENSGEAVALNADNGWTYTWENLPKYSAGEEIDYTADETAVPSGYSKSDPVKTTTDGVATFTVTNNYDPTPVSVDPPVQKVIENNADLYNKGDFTFTIVNTSAPEGVTAPMPANTSITNSEVYEKEGKTGFYEFGEITFTVPGTYEYTIKESGSVDGVTNDPAGMDGKKITFTVTDDGTGKLVVTPTTDQVQLSFTNTYSASGKASITVSKAIEGAAWPSSKTLTLTLTGTGSAPMPETTTATLDAIGSVTFGEIEFNLSDAGKTYTYTIAEDGFGDGWTGSGDVTATVVVTDKGDGTLEATVSYSPEDATITNTYEATGEATITVTKVLAGAAWPSGKTLTLTLAGTDSAPMPETTSVNLTAAGSVSFGPIAYTEADAGKTYTYTIDEDGFGDGWTGSGSITATVVVTDNGDGTLATEVTYSPEDATITNTYVATGTAELEAVKVLKGRDWMDGESFTFTLMDKNGDKIEEISVTKGNADDVKFEAITYTEADAGQTYTYTISETGDLPANVVNSGEITVKVEVTDNGDGTLATEVTYSPEDKTITNTYTPTPVKAQIAVNKTINPYVSGSDKTFTFTLTPVDDAPMPEGKDTLSAEITTENGNGSISFDEIEYTSAGTYQYTVVEKDETAPGWTYDTKTYNVKVTVTDNPETGELSAAIAYPEEGQTAVDVVNEFSEEGTEVILTVHKIIEDLSNSAEDATFTFELRDSNGEKLQEKQITTENFEGEIEFDPIEYTTSGTYNYTIVETGTAPSGWTYDTKEYPVVIVVSDNFETAILESATEIDGETTTKLTITNTYKAAETEGTIKVTKAITDNSGSAPDDVTFTFTLATTDGSPMPSSGKNTTSVEGIGEASFDPIPYDKAGTYNYTITETNDAPNSAWTYDTKVYNVVVTVSDENGVLKATAAYGESSDTSLTITNIYDPEDAKVAPKARKVIDDKSNSAPDETFTFKLSGPDGSEVEVKTRENGGYVEFSELTFDRVGDYEYTIQEVEGSTPGFTYDTDEHKLTITVKDTGDGKLTATITYEDADEEGELIITNVYKADPTSVELKVTKYLEGSAEYLDPEDVATFTFKLATTDDSPMPDNDTVSVQGAGEASFEAITYEEVGTYSYTISEVNDKVDGYEYDETVHIISVEVVDDGGKLSATCMIDGEAQTETGAEFTNSFSFSPVKLDPPVEKVVTGDKPAPTVDFQFTMKAVSNTAGYEVAEMPMPDGSSDGSKTMTITGAGSKEFGEIEYTIPGTYVYEITEENTGAADYTYDTSTYTLTVDVTVEGTELVLSTTCTKDGEEADDIVFTNEYKKTPPPQTGDTLSIALWLILTVGSALGASALVMLRRRMRMKNRLLRNLK